MITFLAWLDRNAGRLLVTAFVVLGLAAVLCLSSCGDVEVRPPAPPAPTVKELVEKVAASDAKAAAAIKTSEDAQRAMEAKQAEIAAARKLIEDDQRDIAALKAEKARLVEAEIAHSIAVAAWWTFAAGALALVLGVFLVLRFPSKTSLAVALSGAGVAVLGLVGVWLAPHWMLVAWIGGGVVLVGAVGGCAWLLHSHIAAGQIMAGQWKAYADQIAPNLRAEMDKASVAGQGKARRIIDRWLRKA